MSMIKCNLCEAEGILCETTVIFCPICHQGMCERQQATVRWRWKSDGRIDATKVCKKCVRSYEHRSWDVYRRDWIT